MTDTFDPGGLFQTGDGIGPLTTPGTPPGYDLTQILSDSMRSRPVWFDLSKASSNVLYTYFESQRIALEMSRDPAHIGRVLKIATLKMMGLDWNSSMLTDDGYDRAISAVSLYNQNHGPEDFLSFMGYVLGLPLSLATLWTTDYKIIVPGPPVIGGTILDSPEGPWYPTTHVGILYEEASGSTSPLDLQANQDELRSVFYKMAPINLVLDWIAPVETLMLNPLTMATALFEEDEDTLQVSPYSPCVVDLRLNSYEGDEEFLLGLYPLNPTSVVEAGMVVLAIDTGIDTTVVNRPGVDWSMTSGIQPGLTIDSQDEYVITGAAGGGLTTVEQPAQNWIVPWNQALHGGLIRPARNQYLANSNNPAAWYAGTVFVADRLFVDGSICPALMLPIASPLVTIGIPSGTHLVSLIVYPEPNPDGSHQTITMTRGSQSVVWNTAGTTVISSCSAYELLPLGSSGFYLLWASMTGGQVSVATQVGTGYVGTISWYNMSVEDAPYPGLPTITDGFVPAVSYSTGWSSTDGSQLQHPYGFMLLRATPVFPEWTSSNQVLLSIDSPLGDNVLVDVDSSGTIGVSIHGGIRTTLGTVSAGVEASVALKWNATAGTLMLFHAGLSTTISYVWPTNFSEVSILKPYNLPPTSLWVVQRVMCLGFDDSTLVPSDALVAWLTGNA